MIVYRLLVRHHEGEPDLSCPIILCDACGKQINEGCGNVYWIAPDHGWNTWSQIWFTHKWPCSELDKEIESKTGEMANSEELDRWLDQLTRNTLSADPIPGHDLDGTGDYGDVKLRGMNPPADGHPYSPYRDGA